MSICLMPRPPVRAKTSQGRRGARWPLIAALLCSALSVACDESLSSLAGPTPNLEPTFSSIQREILNNTQQSGCVTCHTNAGRQPAGGLNLAVDPYAALVGVASSGKPGAIRVIPGDPDNSYLIHKLEGAGTIVGLRMPRVGVTLTDGQIAIIRRWIQLGANRT